MSPAFSQNFKPSGSSQENSSIDPPTSLDCSTVTPYTFYGHLPYPEVPPQNLVEVGNSERLERSAAISFRQMQIAAARDGVTLVPLSGFRDRALQTELFYTIAAQRGQSLQQRARVSAPPGHSEHHTGYAIDIGDGVDSWYDFSQDFERTAAGQWLMKNAQNYGFELSFTRNHPCVSYEPWHWRWVGDADSQFVFQTARDLVPGIRSELQEIELQERSQPKIKSTHTPH
ncbi:D-alanyl-D-alanine carboxypeptidase family protein [Oscillatoriales cyanobacterium LEGE 11467]|uniref:D-alanyl-D-alanine carboxypeptidase family protein n=2 Tax=Zarconia TaxID=2992130 RepID=A0A928VZ51_9CYAN|nr:D-alanyl-D-alanine carboxypeptidase family protein [Zarconia navalis LEGE 11467]